MRRDQHHDPERRQRGRAIRHPARTGCGRRRCRSRSRERERGGGRAEPALRANGTSWLMVISPAVVPRQYATHSSRTCGVASISPVVKSRRAAAAGRRRPVRRPISGRRILQQRRSRQAHHEEDDAENLERRAPADRRDQAQLASGPKMAEPAPYPPTISPDDETALVGKPLRCDRHRRRVAEAVADADDHAEDDVEKRQGAREAGEEEAEATRARLPMRAQSRGPF